MLVADAMIGAEVPVKMYDPSVAVGGLGKFLIDQ
jgi:hypothetical protein